MKCYYEVLGVTRDVNYEDLKKAYRKLALKWHPDKNLDNAVEAKAQFQLVQQAYEVLSDPHERAWYDNHRESILRGAGSDYKDNSLDVFKYFTPFCFKGYGDDDKGFYSVYREVFSKLATEDLEYMSDEDSDFEIPGFGKSDSSYEDVVRHFYAYWRSYSTKKSYAWLDPYDIRDAPNRRVGRAAEKENKKVRDKARKQRNEEVRNLVEFVRKRDKRVQEHAKFLEERALENARKSEEQRKKIIRERQEAVRSYKESEWSKFSNMEKELEAIEASLAAEFGESEESSNGELESGKEETDSVIDSLYCVACNKVFKTPKAFENHENSKKHKENVEVLRASMLDGEKQLNEDVHDIVDLVHSDLEISSSNESIAETNMELEEKYENGEIVEKKAKNKNEKHKSSCTFNASDSDVSDVEFDKTHGQSKKQRKKQKQRLQMQKNQEHNSEADDVESDTDLNNKCESIVGENAKLSFKKAKGKKVKEVRCQKSSTEGQINSPVDISVPSGCNKVKSKKSKEKRNKKFDGISSVQDLNHCCVTCCSEFPSKNKLFDHLKKTGHSVYIPQATVTAAKERTEERGKGKGKKSIKYVGDF